MGRGISFHVVNVACVGRCRGKSFTRDSHNGTPVNVSRNKLCRAFIHYSAHQLYLRAQRATPRGDTTSSFGRHCRHWTCSSAKFYSSEKVTVVPSL